MNATPVDSPEPEEGDMKYDGIGQLFSDFRQNMNPNDRYEGAESLEFVSASVFGTGVSMFRKIREAESHGVILSPGLQSEGPVSLESLYRIGSVHSKAIGATEEKRFESIVFTGETFAVNERLFERTDFIGDPEFIALVESIGRTDSGDGESGAIRTGNTVSENPGKKNAEYYRDVLDAEACLILEPHAINSSRVRIREASGVVLKAGTEIPIGLHVRRFCERGKIFFGAIPKAGIREFAPLAPQPGRRFSSFMLCPTVADRFEYLLCFFFPDNLKEKDVIRLYGML